MFPIAEVTAVQASFPTDVSMLMPKYQDIPEEFRDRHTKWNKLFADFFYFGLEKLELTPKEGVDRDKAMLHIQTVMGSWEPKHEHKEAAVAYLFSEWFTEAVWVRKQVKFER